MKNYDHKKIESKWQKEWEKKKIYQASDKSKKKKFYGLIEFPYPSGAGLHVGHIRSNTAMDIISRKRRMQGFNVLYPIGWDAFGLPTENYAIKTGIHPIKVTKQNTDTFRRQLKELGFSFDWSREINTTDPAYYKWTQWIFLQLYKKGLAYKTKTTINWCPKDKIGLANEEVVGGMCERCGSPTEKREKEQWMLAITKYADRLDKDLDEVDYLEKIKIQQRNWIGRSEGSEIDFKIKDSEEKIKVFTTRADTIFGATYVVLAPEHELVSKLTNSISNWNEVESYVKASKKKDELERTAEGKEKTGVELKGIRAINPSNNQEVPVWVGDYVLVQYGTGAIMAVPAHDERDREFAVKYNLEVTDKPLVDAKEITSKVGGKIVTKYKLRDWVFSRQRYWGEPIPLIDCGSCGFVPVPDKDLPVVLPKVKSYVPTGTGESPLATISKWVNVKCPKCKGKAKRETDTMPNWAGSSWYYLRYTDPKNKKEFASKKNLKYFTPVDWYNGGMEHTTLHLLYSRFWHKFLYDLNVVPTSEPYAKRTSHGMILATDGAKMSKSLGNTVDPKDIVKTYGADTIRLYEMFMGPFDQVVSWNTESMVGPRRFLERVWKLNTKVDVKAKSPKEFLTVLHKTIQKVSEDIENMRFNTSVSALMILSSEFEKLEKINPEDYEKFLQILAPFAPHIAEELWLELGNKKSIHVSDWPKVNNAFLKENEVKIGIQVNGKVRAEIVFSSELEEGDIKELALKNEVIIKFLDGNVPKKIIYVKNRLINIVL
ncbi:MAG: leucine--tRNA ligase [bacterium]|nr:leucine--tRNA ligase [bacterium]